MSELSEAELERHVIESSLNRLGAKRRVESAQNIFQIMHDTFASAVYDLEQYREQHPKEIGE